MSDYTALRAALAAGPTAGEREIDRKNWPMELTGRYHRVITSDGFPVSFVPAWSEPGPGEVDGTSEALANAALVSAADPATIAALLAALDEARRDAERYRFLRAVYNIPISTQAARDPVVYDAAIDAAMKGAP